VLQQGDVIFLKGSRRIGLDKVVAGLKEAVSGEKAL
jgi:UDP-N-acetylmuramyl pentapeptide synthase